MPAMVRVLGVLTIGSLLQAAGLSDASETPSKPLSTQQPGKATSPAIVIVNGEPITEADVRFMKVSRQMAKTGPAGDDDLVERLIDRVLVRKFLASRKAEVDAKQLDDAVGQLKRQLRESNRNPDELLGELGYDDARVREELSLLLAWQGHVRRVSTTAEIQKYFESHRAEFDGTEVRASQIFRKLPSEPGSADVENSRKLLADLRTQIVAGKRTFADAAREHSEAPSREQGGDVGWFAYRGRMPVEISSVAFGLQKGEVSAPFRTRFGLHLVTVTDRKAGEISLEDARPEILSALSDSHWRKVVAQERARAKIEYKPPRS